MIRAVRDVSISLCRGETLAIVGETGSGKTTLALSLMGLLDNQGHIESGQILFAGRDLAGLKAAEWRSVRGMQVGMVFQDPRSALNPVLNIGSHLAETLRAHSRLSAKAAMGRAKTLLREVGIPDPEFSVRRYPLQLSGGMCQRVSVALAVCNGPSLLIADEPTSALDPTIQAQVLALLSTMRERHGLALLLISHDLALVSQYADRVGVMYGGHLVEMGPACDLFAHPAHPYTKALLECIPTLAHSSGSRRLCSIDGNPAEPGYEIGGCSFAPRCKTATPECRASVPPERSISERHWASCIRIE
jgi:oligopeptide/dipeptide ABC transporter ATP-binding protein